MNSELIQYAKLVPFLGKTLGNSFEIILYDMTDPSCPVIASANSILEDQEKLRAFLPEAASGRRIRSRGYLANYPFPAESGKMLKLSAYLIPGPGDEVLGALCVCLRCELFFQMDAFLKETLRFQAEEIGRDAPAPEPPESSPELSLDTVWEVIRESGVAPERATQKERMQILFTLYGMGVYNLKGAVARTAEALRISEQSVYRYLAKIKKAGESC